MAEADELIQAEFRKQDELIEEELMWRELGCHGWNTSGSLGSPVGAEGLMEAVAHAPPPKSAAAVPVRAPNPVAKAAAANKAAPPLKKHAAAPKWQSPEAPLPPLHASEAMPPPLPKAAVAGQSSVEACPGLGPD